MTTDQLKPDAVSCRIADLPQCYALEATTAEGHVGIFLRLDNGSTFKWSQAQGQDYIAVDDSLQGTLEDAFQSGLKQRKEKSQ